MFWTDIVLFFAGLIVIALAFVLSQRLGNKPVQFGFDKLGLDLKADRLTFVLVVGLVLIGVGVFFRYQNYEAKLHNLDLQVEAFKSEHNKNLESLREELRQFKVYDLGLNIVFPNVPGEDVEKSFEIQIFTKKQNEAFALRDYKPITNFGETFVNLSNLNRGERVRIVALDKRNKTKWESNSDILVPETQIVMTKK